MQKKSLRSSPGVPPQHAIVADLLTAPDLFLVSKCAVSVYTVPTETPEADGTISWSATTLILVELTCADKTGVGFTYGHKAVGQVCEKLGAEIVCGKNVLDIPFIWLEMVKSVRNAGRPGVCSMAISAIDCALHDLKAKVLGVTLGSLLGLVRKAVPVYGSGGFTNYTQAQLEKQLEGWLEQGIRRVKMKIGTQPEDDLERVKWARKIIGDEIELFVDANGAYSRKQALMMAQGLSDLNVKWFEEPVSSDDLAGLRLLRDRAPASMAITAGEYGFDSMYFRRMLEAQAVDVLMADASRCGGITGFMQAAALCDAFQINLSSHCAPSLHVAIGCAAIPVLHLEYFYDHARIEQMFFEGTPRVRDGMLVAQTNTAGAGLDFKRKDAAKYAD